jgi:hypothetical protein
MTCAKTHFLTFQSTWTRSWSQSLRSADSAIMHINNFCDRGSQTPRSGMRTQQQHIQRSLMVPNRRWLVYWLQSLFTLKLGSLWSSRLVHWA